MCWNCQIIGGEERLKLGRFRHWQARKKVSQVIAQELENRSGNAQFLLNTKYLIDSNLDMSHGKLGLSDKKNENNC